MEILEIIEKVVTIILNILLIAHTSKKLKNSNNPGRKFASCHLKYNTFQII